jgi:diguanylate cyclase (GGDEF)-like protein
MNFFEFLETWTKRQIALAGFFLVCAIGIGDFLAGPQLSTSIFYVVPVGICAWHGNRRMAFVAALISAFVWLVTDIASGQSYSHSFILYWNGLSRLGTFIIIAYLLSRYRFQLAVEEKLAATDPLTGALNNRAFYEKVEGEIERSRRFHHPFSVAYIDLDNFKSVNDTMGHIKGDLLLQKIVGVMTSNTRVIDVVARLGGDEFAILYPETGVSAAQEAVSKWQSVSLAAMRTENWPITFSIGVLTCEEPPDSVKQVINIADGLMYSVKKSGKNRIAYASLEQGVLRVL